MANKIKYDVQFGINRASLSTIKKELNQLRNLTKKDLIKIDGQSTIETLGKINEQAQKVEQALTKAYNFKLGTVNIENFNDSLKQSGSSIQQVYNEFSKAGAAGENAFRDLTSTVLKTNLQLKESHTILDKMAETFFNAFKYQVATKVLNSVTGSIQQAWGYTKALDTSLNDIRIVTGKSADEMARFAVQANEVAQNLGKSTTDYTNAALIYAQQGLSDKEVAERAAITLKAANVTGQSTDDVSEQLTAVWNGYKVTASEAQLYVDRLAAVAAKTASDLEELSTGMSKVASAAAAMGVGQDQLAAQLSTIISVTKQAPESVGTALRTVYARISDIQAGIDEDGVSLGNYSGKMKQLGINVLNANGKLRDMGEVMEEIGGKWDTLTREQQVYLAQTMAGQRQYNNLLALFDNFEEYNKALNTAQNAAGTLQEQQDIYMESTEAHLESLRTAVEDIFDSFLDTDDVEPLIDLLAELASITADWIDGLGGGINILKSLGSIGLVVFSDQIAKGINTTINNLQIGKQNARQFEQILQGTQDFQKIEGLDESTQKLLQNREQIIKLSEVMTPEQFSGFQKALENITKFGNQVKKTTEEIPPLEAALKKLSDLSLSQILNDKDKSEEITKDYDAALEALNNLIKTGKEAKEIFKTGIAKVSQGNGGNYKQVFSNLSESLAKIKVDLQNFKETKVFKGLSEEAQKEFNNIIEQYNNLIKIINDSSIGPQDKINAYKSFFETISQTAKNSSKEVQEAFGDLYGALFSPEDILAMERKKEEYKKLVADFVSSQQKIQRAVDIKNWASLAGGIGQVTSSIQQLQHLGSIFTNTDIKGGQKLLQIISNLAFSLPMLVNGFSKVTKALGLVKIASTEAQLAAVKQMTTNTFLGGSFSLVQTAAEKSAIAVNAFGNSLIMTPIGATITLLAGLAVAVGIVANAYEEARKQQIQTNKEVIQQANQTQEQLEKNKELYKSLEELDQKREDGLISRAELKSGIEDLIKQYDLEGQAAERLRNNYNNLIDTIKELKREQAEQKRDSAKEEYEAAKENLQFALQDSPTFGPILSDNFYEISPESKKILSEIGGFRQQIRAGIESFSVDINTDNMNAFAEQYSKIEKAVSSITDINDRDSEWFKSLQDWLKLYRQQVDAYRNAIKDLEEYQTQFATLSKEIDFSNINNTQDYLDTKTKIEEQVTAVLKAEQKERGYDDSYIEKRTKQLSASFLRVNASEAYNQFGQVEDFLDSIEKKAGEIPDYIKKSLAKLDGKQLDFLFSLDSSTLSNWQLLKQAIEDISKMDMSNLNPVTSFDDAALQQYSIYNSLEEQIRSGKNISKSQFGGLLPEIQEFFTITANKTYQLTGSIDEFYQKVRELKLDGLQNNLTALEDKANMLQKLSEGSFNFEAIDKNAARYDDDDGDYLGVDSNLIQKQLDYLEAFAGNNAKLQEEISLWRENFENLGKEQAQAIYDRIGEYNLDQGNLQETTEEIKKWQQIVHDAMFPTDSDIDQSALVQLKNTIQDFAEPAAELADSLEQDDRAAEDVAESILRFDDAVQDVVKNYDDWAAALASGSWQAIEDMRDAYADLLNLDGSSLSKEFLTNAENLDLMKAAIDGNTEAYDQLLQRAGQDIATQVHLDTETFKTDFDNLMDLYYQGQELDDMEIGAELNDENFLAELSNMVNSAGMSAQQATDYLASMGVDAQVIQQKQTAQDVHQYTDAIAEVTPGEQYLSADPATGHPITYRFPSVQYRIEPSQSSETVEKTAFALKVTSAHKSSGGGFKFSKAPNGGGSKGQARRAKAGKSNGGKGSSQGPDTSQKDRKKPLEDTRDIYHDINIQLEQINRQLDRAQKKQDNLYGKQLLDNLNKQTAILEQHKKKLKQKQGIQQEDLKNQQKTLNNLGVEFDEYGNIANYMSLLAVRQAEINARTKDYNKLIEQYNQSTDKTTKEQIAKEAEAINKQIQEAENDYKQLEKKIKDYDKLRQDMEDLVDDIEEETQKQIEINIKKFRMSLEIRLEMDQAEKDWNEFRRKVLEHSDVIKGTEFESILADARQQGRNLTSYFQVGGGIGSVQALTSQILMTRQQIDEINKTGTSDIYGDNKAKAMEDLQNDLSELMSQLEDIQSLIDDIDKAYLSTIDDIEKQFDKQIQDYEYVGELIQHDMDLLDLLYGDKNFDAMNKYYTTLIDNNLKQLDSLKQQRDFWGQQWRAAVQAGDINAAEKFEENYKKTIQDLNKLIEDSAKTIQEKYTNTINKIFNELDQKLTNGKGVDYLNTEWQLMNKNADEYLDTINTAFAIQQTEQKYKDAINDTKDIKNQQALKKLMDQQLDILRNKEKVTQYDVERAEKMLQIEQARIALEDMQAAKTTMRLKRDSQGNYSYQYVADDDAVDEARAKLAEAQNDLYNFDKQRYKANLDDMLAAWRDFQSEYKDIVNDTSLTEEERIRNLALLRDQYGEYINNKLDENLIIRNNLQESAFNDLAALYDKNYEDMVQSERQVLMGQLVPMWKSGIQEMADTIVGEGGFIPACQEGFESIDEATENYKDELKEMADVAGVSLEDVQNGVDHLADDFSKLIEVNDILIDRMGAEISAIQILRAEAANLVNEYKNVYDAAINAVGGINDYIRAEQRAAAQAVSNAQYMYNGIVNAAAKARQMLNNLGFDAGGSSAAGSGSGTDGTNSSIGNIPSDSLEELLKRKNSSKYVSPGGGVKVLNAYTTQYYDSGGYTGDWNSSDGKLAVLHEKELVLNAKDTSNILNVVKIVRSLSDSLRINTAQRLSGLSILSHKDTNNNSDIEQNVHIEATFPNVDSKKQIEEAFDDLINLAAQRVLR